MSTIALYLGFLMAGILGWLELIIVKIILFTYLISLALAITIKIFNDYKREKPLK